MNISEYEHVCMIPSVKHICVHEACTVMCKPVSMCACGHICTCICVYTCMPAFVIDRGKGIKARVCILRCMLLGKENKSAF